MNSIGHVVAAEPELVAPTLAEGRPKADRETQPFPGTTSAFTWKEHACRTELEPQPRTFREFLSGAGTLQLASRARQSV